MKILDCTCGSRMFWFDKRNRNCVFMDNRELDETLCDGRRLIIEPDVIGDFTKMPFRDEYFHLVVFDPPHLIRCGNKSWLKKKYGILNSSWKDDIRRGFNECFRVLKKNGVLIFKWNEQQISVNDIIKEIGYDPIFGNKTSKNTIWLVFVKESRHEEIKECELF